MKLSKQLSKLTPIQAMTSSPQARSLLVSGGMFLLGYYFIARPILKRVGILKSDAKLAEEDRQSSELQMNEAYRRELSVIKPSFPAVKYAEIANIIYDAIGSYTANDNEDKVYAQFGLLQNERDLIELRKAFGLRSRKVLGFGVSQMDLGTMLNNALSNGEVDKINQILSSKNIAYRF